VKASHVLQAMNLGADIAGSAIRVSLGWSSTGADIDCFIEAWRSFAARRGLAAGTQSLGGLTAA
jgi:cysteine desulfurase